jgi:hypothetical protein
LALQGLARQGARAERVDRGDDHRQLFAIGVDDAGQDAVARGGDVQDRLAVLEGKRVEVGEEHGLGAEKAETVGQGLGALQRTGDDHDRLGEAPGQERQEARRRAAADVGDNQVVITLGGRRDQLGHLGCRFETLQKLG